METDNTIITNTLPYDKLSLIGINRHMANEMPPKIKDDLLNGKLTPLIKLDIVTSNGATVSMPVKLQLSVDDYGKSKLFVHPVRRDISEKTAMRYGITNPEKDVLNKGNVIIKEVELKGEKKVVFIQKDSHTNSLLITEKKNHNIDRLLNDIEKIKDIDLGLTQKEQARLGKPIELDVGGEKVSVGVDLKEPKGFKLIKGDLKEWEKQQQIKYDIAHPEYIGLVQTEQNKWEYKQVVDGLNHEKKSEQSIKPGGMRR